MEAKELKVQVPEGYEIDIENSTFKCIRFKPIKKDITYEDVCNSMLTTGYYTDNRGKILHVTEYADDVKIDKNKATNKKQLKKLLALNQLLNITEYYNYLSVFEGDVFTIIFSSHLGKYIAQPHTNSYNEGIIPLFNYKKDAQAVVDNPNFREILDTIYKD